MVSPVRSPSEPLLGVLNWVARCGITVTDWPRPADAPDADLSGQVRLYFVAEGAEPPRSWGLLEDWARRPLDRVELTSRAESILARAGSVGRLPARVDDDGVLRMGDQLAILSPVSARLLQILLDHEGEAIERPALVHELWPGGLPECSRALDLHIAKLRKRLRGMPLLIHTLRGRGFLVEQVPSVPSTEHHRAPG